MFVSFDFIVKVLMPLLGLIMIYLSASNLCVSCDIDHGSRIIGANLDISGYDSN